MVLELEHEVLELITQVIEQPKGAMAASVPWDQSPEFLAATERQIPPGGLTAYVNPRPIGDSPSDVTSFVYGLARWSDTDFLPLFYQWEPTPEWVAFKNRALPPQKVDADGTPLFEPFPEPGKELEPLLEFPGLPDQIGTQETWEFLEYVRRVDPRIRWIDILMRTQLNGRRSQTALNTEASRGRDVYNMSSWHITLRTPRPSTKPLKGNIFERLTPVQRAGNTTRGITPGFINPALGVIGGRIPHPWKSIRRKMKAPKRGPPKELPDKQNDGFQEIGDLETFPQSGASDQPHFGGAVNFARTEAFPFPTDTPDQTNESVLRDSAPFTFDNGSYRLSQYRFLTPQEPQSYYANSGMELPATDHDSLFLPNQESYVSDPVGDTTYNASSQAGFSRVDDTPLFPPGQESSHISEDQDPDNSRLHPSTDELEAENSETDVPESNFVDHNLYDYFGYPLPWFP